MLLISQTVYSDDPENFHAHFWSWRGLFFKIGCLLISRASDNIRFIPLKKNDIVNGNSFQSSLIEMQIFVIWNLWIPRATEQASVRENAPKLQSSGTHRMAKEKPSTDQENGLFRDYQNTQWQAHKNSTLKERIVIYYSSTMCVLMLIMESWIPRDNRRASVRCA